MQLSRVSIGIIAAIVAILAMFVVQALETRFLGMASSRSLMMTFVGAGIAVLWLGDRLGLLASAYTEPPLNLRTSEHTNADNRGERYSRDNIRQRLDAMRSSAPNNDPALLVAVDLPPSDQISVRANGTGFITPTC